MVQFVVFPGLECRHVVQIGGGEQNVVIEGDMVVRSELACERVITHRMRVAPRRILEVLGSELPNRLAPGAFGIPRHRRHYQNRTEQKDAGIYRWSSHRGYGSFFVNSPLALLFCA